LQTPYGVVPVRRSADRSLKVLLITSRETRRWVVPRGNPIPGKGRVESAAQEAFEEAGLLGRIEPVPLGRYRYDKRRRDGSVVAAEVDLFRMEVESVADRWPEMAERERRWFDVAAAAAAVAEADLAALILRLDG
jgi:8-oxo-dGTP pyrophosphatase MutT (NUDIX family)